MAKIYPDHWTPAAIAVDRASTPDELRHALRTGPVSTLPIAEVLIDLDRRLWHLENPPRQVSGGDGWTHPVYPGDAS